MRPHTPTPRFAPRHLGPTVVGSIFLANALLWLALRPAVIPWRTYLGQLIGAQSVLLLSLSLVLVSMLPQVEHWFDGIDRAAIWHRRLAIAGLLLLLPHILFSTNFHHSQRGPLLGLVGLFGLVGLAVWSILPRWRAFAPRAAHGAIDSLRALPGIRGLRALLGGYERWRALHRTTGVFVAAGFVHGVLDGSPFQQSATLRWSFLVIGGVGLAFYVYRELLARFFLSLHDYRVAAVTPLAGGITEVELEPLGRPLRFVPGQFAMVYLEAKDGWHRHPFTIASGVADRRIRFTVKALGDYTSQLGETLRPGMPAVIGGPYGRFTHAKGTRRQVWIAGGVGVAPFLSWLRSLGSHAPAGDVDFFYSTDGTAPFADEVAAIAREHDVRVHVVDTRVDGRLTPDRVLTAVGARVDDLSVFLCGPTGMITSLTTGLRAAGVAPRHIHREHFDWR